MLGQNVWPDAYDPIADTLDENKVATAMQQMRQAYRDIGEKLPTHEAFIRQTGGWHDEMPQGFATRAAVS